MLAPRSGAPARSMVACLTLTTNIGLTSEQSRWQAARNIIPAAGVHALSLLRLCLVTVVAVRVFSLSGLAKRLV